MEMRAPSICVLHGLDPGDRSSTTTTSIPIPASNYTVDLSNTTNPPPPQQLMVKPAVMMHREATSNSVIHSDRGCPAHPHPSGSGVGLRNPRRNLLRTRRNFTEFRQEGPGNRYIFRGHVHCRWSTPDTLHCVGRTFGAEEGETESYYEYTLWSSYEACWKLHWWGSRSQPWANRGLNLKLRQP